VLEDFVLISIFWIALKRQKESKKFTKTSKNSQASGLVGQGVSF